MREEKRRRRKYKGRSPFLTFGLPLFLAIVAAVVILYPYDSKLEARFASGEAALASGDYESGVAIFQRLHSRHPHYERAPEALLLAGNTLDLYLHRPQEALLCFLLVEHDYPGTDEAARAQRRSAEIYKLRLDDYRSAVVAYQKLLNTGVKDGDRIQYEIADSYFRLDNFEQARIEFEILARDYPQSSLLPEVAYRVAVTYSLEGRLEEAAKAFAAVAERWPQDGYAVEARLGLAAALEEGERLSEALDVLTKLLGVYPNAEVIDKRIRQVKERMGKKKKAI